MPEEDGAAALQPPSRSMWVSLMAMKIRSDLINRFEFSRKKKRTKENQKESKSSQTNWHPGKGRKEECSMQRYKLVHVVTTL
jgi:hypothetical protein